MVSAGGCHHLLHKLAEHAALSCLQTCPLMCYSPSKTCYFEQFQKYISANPAHTKFNELGSTCMSTSADGWEEEARER